MFVLGSLVPAFCADKYGRRKPLMWGCFGMAVSMMLIAVTLSVPNNNHASIAAVAFFFTVRFEALDQAMCCFCKDKEQYTNSRPIVHAHIWINSQLLNMGYGTRNHATPRSSQGKWTGHQRHLDLELHSRHDHTRNYHAAQVESLPDIHVSELRLCANPVLLFP